MLSIIIPSYNSGQTLRKQLPGLTHFLKKKNIAFEIIIVDDGSADGDITESVCKENNGTYFKLKKNSGKGAAVKMGMRSASGDFRIYTDSDIPFNYDAIDVMLKSLQDCDMAIGDRTIPGSVYFSEIPLLRKIGSRLFSFFVKKIITPGFPDTQCGLKGFKAKVANELFSISRISGYAFDVELIHLAIEKKYCIERIPVQLRLQEGSGINIFNHFLKMILDVLRIKWKIAGQTHEKN